MGNAEGIQYGEIDQHQPGRQVVLVETGCGGAHVDWSNPAGNMTTMP